MNKHIDRDKNIFNAVYDLVAVATIACSIGGIVFAMYDLPYLFLMATVLCGAITTAIFMVWLRGKIQKILFRSSYA